MAGAAPAHAGDSPDELSYFLDGHAALIYGSLAGMAGLRLFAEPPDTPRFFDPDEGGAPHKGDTVPSWALVPLAGVTGATVLFAPADGRWYHVKGLAEALATTGLFTSMAKYTFGRHRPEYVAGDPVTGVEDSRLSFFSGHSSVTLACTTYLGLYMRYHLAPRWRPAGSSLAWWEAATYAGLAGISVFVPVSRVMDNRHHPTDVLTGSLVGASLSAGFFFWQQRRYERSRKEVGTAARRPVPARWTMELVPVAEPAGVAVVGRF